MPPQRLGVSFTRQPQESATLYLKMYFGGIAEEMPPHSFSLKFT